jgi:hypothetical protein
MGPVQSIGWAGPSFLVSSTLPRGEPPASFISEEVEISAGPLGVSAVVSYKAVADAVQDSIFSFLTPFKTSTSSAMKKQKVFPAVTYSIDH